MGYIRLGVTLAPGPNHLPTHPVRMKIRLHALCQSDWLVYMQINTTAVDHRATGRGLREYNNPDGKNATCL